MQMHCFFAKISLKPTLELHCPIILKQIDFLSFGLFGVYSLDFRATILYGFLKGNVINAENYILEEI